MDPNTAERQPPSPAGILPVTKPNPWLGTDHPADGLLSSQKESKVNKAEALLQKDCNTVLNLQVHLKAALIGHD